MAIKAKRPVVDEKQAEEFIKKAEQAHKTEKYTDKYTRLTWYVDKQQVKRLKQIALDKDTDTSTLNREAIDMVIKKYSSKST